MRVISALTIVMALAACGPPDSDDCEAKTTFYRDLDGDGFGSDIAEPKQACAAPSGYVGNSLDKADFDARARPNQSEFQGSVINGAKSIPLAWDFNFDGVEEGNRGDDLGGCNNLSSSCQVRAAYWDATSTPPCGSEARWIAFCSSHCVANAEIVVRLCK